MAAGSVSGVGFWTEQVKGSAPAVFATDVPLESKVLGSIQGRLLPINEFSGTQLDPVHSAGFIWNLASPESAGFIWNLASPNRQASSGTWHRQNRQDSSGT